MSLSESYGCSHDLINQIMHSYRDQFLQEWNSCLLSEPCCLPHPSPVLLHIYCPHPLCCCIYTALIPCVAAYILPSSPVLLHIYCPHPLCCSIYTALVFPLYGTLIPTSFNILMKIFLPLHLTLKCFEIHTSMCIHDSFNFFSIATSTFMSCVYTISITEIYFSNRYVHLNGSIPFQAQRKESISDALKFTLLCAYMAL